MRNDPAATIATLVVVTLVALIVWLTVHNDNKKEREHAVACAHLMSLARTPRDTLDVSMRCELKDDRSQIVPIPVVIPAGRR